VGAADDLVEALKHDRGPRAEAARWSDSQRVTAIRANQPPQLSFHRSGDAARNIQQAQQFQTISSIR
jgi:hypothetical protein